MHAISFFATLLLAFITTSCAWSPIETRQNADAATPSVNNEIQKTCHHIRALRHLTALANNQTELDTLLAEGLYTASQEAYIKSRAAASASELATLTSNTTLTSECDILNARRAVRKQCRRLSRLEQLTELANNQTAYNEFLAADTFNKKQVEDLLRDMETAEIELQMLRENATLITTCTREPELNDGGISMGEYRIDNIREMCDANSGVAAVDQSGAISLTSGAVGLLLPYLSWICVPILVTLGMGL
jgi:hypothetical protein